MQTLTKPGATLQTLLLWLIRSLSNPLPHLPLRHRTLYTSRKPLQHLLATGVHSYEEPGSAHEQTCKISRKELPHPFKQRQDELRERNFFVSLTLWWRLLISVDSTLQQDNIMGDPLPHSQSSLVPSLFTIIHHPELQKVAFAGP